ncbi:MAG: hypothetical protein ACJAQ3_001569 [Planctomycetota bacterium]|jgi:hypothetical protein
MLLTSLALLAAPLQGAGGYCLFDPQVEIQGVLTSLPGTLPAPFDAASLGDPARLVLSYAGDVGCLTSSGMEGRLSTPGCCFMTLGNAEGGMDPQFAGCDWGETYSSPIPKGTIAVEAMATFAGGQVTARLVMSDPNAAVGIGLWDIAFNTIHVPSVTAPGFTISLELIDPNGAVLATIDALELSGSPGGFGGVPYCNANPNSTGLPGSMAFIGTNQVAENDLSLFAGNLPSGTFAYFLTSRTQTFIPNLPGSAGILCVGGSVGRFVGPGQIQATGSGSIVTVAIDLTQMPQPTGPVVVQPGETWHFTCWFRDVTGSTTNNFADGSSVFFH